MSPRRAKNTNRQGANFELMIMADLNRHGYTTLRSSGSHGAVDVVAVGDHHTLWIQAKISKPVIPPAERNALWDVVSRAGGLPIVAYRVPGAVLYRELIGVKPKEWEMFTPAVSQRAVCGNPACEHPYNMHQQHADDMGCWVLRDDRMCGCLAFELKGLK